jgi:hypothetical protein|tara:strand:+ start:4796 stop:5404 length:609 start_codon:yes stop_codon:yes gene_type:complete
MGFLQNNENYAWFNQVGAIGGGVAGTISTGLGTGSGANITSGGGGGGAISTGPATGVSGPSTSIPTCASVNNDCGCFYGGCTDPTAQNYDPSATCSDGSCIAGVMGCTNPSSIGYNSLATIDDGSCITPVSGCSDPNATNYNAQANVDCNGNLIGGGSISTGPSLPSSGGTGASMSSGFDGGYSNFNQQGFGGYNDQMWFND